ncbi:serine hydrolase [Virgibacillus oceani]|uniref:Serine hydrolase n=1 Tax=Virgibacillus oceani TaxID=1479511 RepID=A0A917H8X7_9BACI|nr:serine hydrolase [Virgibacillus oceani]GGG71430.1 serine hydrolase [Virgibacillus oceani]
MNFNQLKSSIQNLVHDAIDNFSIFIQTKDGTITINAYEPRKAASVIKVPMLIEAFRQIENNIFNPNALVYIEDDMKVGGAGIINYLTNSNVYSYKNLLELMIIVSDNTAANLILDKIGIHNVNGLSSMLECRHTHIGRKFMDQEAQQKGLENYTSAFDMFQYLRLAREPNNIINEDTRKQILTILSHQQLKEKLPYYMIDEDNLNIFHKTGELPGVEHDAAIVNYREKTVYAVILTEGFENNSHGKTSIATIGKYVIDYMKH